ncbi:hypothetical protein MTO96_006186 [Rhipicephalus appendiculatus]
MEQPLLSLIEKSKLARTEAVHIMKEAAELLRLAAPASSLLLRAKKDFTHNWNVLKQYEGQIDGIIDNYRRADKGMNEAFEF